MEKTTLKVCKNHGLTEFHLRKDGVYRCHQCSIDRTNKMRRLLKEKLVKYKGGKCEKCGYDNCIAALEFHHLSKDEKEFGISEGNIKSLDKLKKEVDKCILVCSRCHKEIHYNEWLKNEEKRQDLILKNNKEYESNCILYNQRISTNFNVKGNLNVNDIRIDIEKNHLKYKDIALKYNVSLSTIKRFIYENKINRNIENSKNFSKDVFIEIARKCNCNKTEMSKFLGINVKTMERWCAKNDIPFTKGLLKIYISSIS